MYRQSVMVYDRFLGNLSNILEIAEAHCTAANIKPEVFMGLRLFPDMFPFARQVQLACDFAARGAARLTGIEPKSFPDVETNFSELQQRVAAAREYLKEFSPDAFADAATRQVHLKLRTTEMTLSGEDFLNNFSLPQFFFHITTAYDILRANGVALGKRHYMGG